MTKCGKFRIEQHIRMNDKWQSCIWLDPKKVIWLHPNPEYANLVQMDSNNNKTN